MLIDMNTELSATVPPVAIDSMIQPVIYTRFSTERQDKASTERQTAKGIAYCRQFASWLPPLVFSDEAVPGVTTSREGLDEMFEFCALHPGTPIVVETMSRVSRDGGAYAHFFQRRRETRAVTHLVNFGKMDDFTEAIFQALASYEYRNLLTLMRDGRAQHAAKGKVVGRLPFAAMKDENGYFCWHPQDRLKIVQIFVWAAEGFSKAEVARKMNVLEFDAMEAAGVEMDREGFVGPWSPSRVRLIVRNPIYLGRRLFRPGTLAWEQFPAQEPDVLDFGNVEVGLGANG